LVYIGIRIVIASAASDKAKYKEMLGDWLVGMVLLFTMHYIMYFANLAVNELTNFLNTINPSAYVMLLQDNGGEDKGDIHKTLKQYGFKFYDGKLPFTHSNVYPATKEQRDTLMKAMADAGYTFDFEKKELKKVEPKFHVGDWVMVSTAVGDRVVQIASVGYLKDGHPSYITTEGRWFDNRTKACLLTDMEISILPESRVIVTQKPSEWSEEDEKLFNRICDLIHEADFANYQTDENGKELGEYAKMMRLLKFLKDCIQSKQEWSKEDEKNINFLCELLTDLQVKSTENEIKHGTNSHSEYYYNIKKWLKSIKERIGV
jgi:hypothetical protein